jgi:hypothetical protein
MDNKKRVLGTLEYIRGRLDRMIQTHTLDLKLSESEREAKDHKHYILAINHLDKMILESIMEFEEIL